MGNLVFQATLGGQVNLVGPNTASTFNLNVPAVAGTLVTTGDTGTVTSTMLASSVYTTPGTIGSGTPNTGAFTTLSATGVATFSAGSASAPAITTTGDTNTGLFFPAADTVGITTGGTERARVDSSGNLGLGVTPSTWYSTVKAFQFGAVGSLWANSTFGNNSTFASNVYLNASASHIYLTNGYATKYQQFDGTHLWYTAASGSAGGTVSFTQAMTLDASGNLIVGGTSQIGSSKLGVQRSSAGEAFRWTDGATGGYIGTVANVGCDFGFNSALLFKDGTTERMRMDGSGNLLVGRTSTVSAVYNGTPRLFVNDSISATNGSTSVQLTGASSYEGLYFNSGYFRVYNSSGAGVYLQSGNTSWSSTSDERLKDIIEPISNAANKVSTLRAVIGKYKTDDEGTRRSFLIAQDVQSVLPEAVSETPDGMLGVSYTDTIPLLVAAIKEQQAIIQQLQADVAALKG